MFNKDEQYIKSGNNSVNIQVGGDFNLVLAGEIGINSYLESVDSYNPDCLFEQNEFIW